MKKYTLILFILFAFLSAKSQSHWESIISGNDAWSYLAATSAPPVNWNQPGFDDSSWNTGIGCFGYSDGDDVTILSTCNSVYLRKILTISDITLLSTLLLDIDYDDAFVLYLNGKEVSRSSNVTDNLVLYNSAVTIDHEALIYQGLTPERFILNLNDLHAGENTIAVQILNYNINSSDLSGLVFLQSKVNSTDILYNSTPTWFIAPVESNLPLVQIDTKGQTILNDTKITANMKVINNKSGINSPSDTTYEYNGFIGIEIRGSSSLMFEKKSFTIETRTDSATNLNVSLMGMPKENDWVLYAPYSDKSLIRNVLAYNMGNMTGRWSPRTRYCEVYINNEYRGVYVLVEKIKIDKNRLDLAKLKTTDTAGELVSGGYILKIDRPDSGNWVSPYKARNNIQNVPISYVSPKCEDLTIEQKNYIKDYVTAFETSLWSSNYKDPDAGYLPYVNITSFVDYFIINEISRNLDANRVSTFFYKDRGGKITMGPFWDYNIAFGNANFFSAGNTQGWVVDGVGNGDEYGITFWWDKFRLDPYFNGNLRNRWDELRAVKFNNYNIIRIIDSCASVLKDAQVRNFQKFNILSKYVWPNNNIGNTYANEVTYLRNWVTSRMLWMDGQIKLLSPLTAITDFKNNSCEVLTFPNPFTDKFKINLNLTAGVFVNIQISNILGKSVFNQSKYCNAGANEFEINYNELETHSDLFIYKISIDNLPVSSGKIMHQ
ncbi:MAG: CotH kinase family protein [Paludibacter sp.]|nr:CotH kinase family protein [Paludibacter sp.]